VSPPHLRSHQKGLATGEGTDAFAAFKNQQKQSWSRFAPMEMITMFPAAFRAEYDASIAEYFHDNAVQQTYLMTRAKKK
jgi:hypothetical protein